MKQPNIAVLTQSPLPDWVESVVRKLGEKGTRPEIIESVAQLSGREWDAGWLRVVPEVDSSDIPGYWRAAEALEANGISLLNSTSSHLRAYNKLFAGEFFTQAGLPTPKTWKLDSSLPQDLPEQLICKPITASRGFGVIEVSGWQQALNHQQDLGIPCLLQERIDAARCIRVVCTPDKVIRAYEKHVEPDQLVASVALGAEMIYLEPTEEMCQLSQEVVGAVGGTLMGVDLLEENDGKLWALEVNASFGFAPQDQVLVDGMAEEIVNLLPA